MSVILRDAAIPNMTVAVGNRVAFRAWGTCYHVTPPLLVEDVPMMATWRSSDPSCLLLEGSVGTALKASLDAQGNPMPVTVSATFGGTTGYFHVTIQNPAYKVIALRVSGELAVV